MVTNAIFTAFTRFFMPVNRAIYRTLTNVIYIGKVALKDEVFDGEQAAIVDTAIFERTQQLLSRNGPDASSRHRVRRHEFLLRGLLRCRTCGTAMSPSWTKQRGRTYRYYVCTAVNKHGAKVCTVRSVSATAIEQFVVEQVRSIATDPALLEAVFTALTDRQHDEVPALRSERERIARDHAACIQKSKHVLEALGSNDKKASKLAAGHLAELDTRAQALENRVAELDVSIAALKDTTITRDEVAKAMALWAPVWDVLRDQEKGRVLSLLLDSIVYDENHVALTFFPLGIAHLAAEAATEHSGSEATAA